MKSDINTAAAKTTQSKERLQTIKTLSSLLALPGDLRNKIYRLTLLRYGEIHHTKDDFVEPTLLTACILTREEASKVYYFENEFRVCCEDWDPAVLVAFYRRMLRLEGGYDHVLSRFIRWIHAGSYRHKSNLLKYLKAHYDGKVIGLKYCGFEPGDVLKNAIKGAFEIVRRTGRRSTWPEVEQVLEIYLQQICAQDCGSWRWE